MENFQLDSSKRGQNCPIGEKGLVLVFLMFGNQSDFASGPMPTVERMQNLKSFVKRARQAKLQKHSQEAKDPECSIASWILTFILTLWLQSCQCNLPVMTLHILHANCPTLPPSHFELPTDSNAVKLLK
jgi:hypothetical protein